MSEELKPCPFCGSTDIRNVSSTHPGPSYHFHAGDTIFAVNCGNCGASVPNRYRNELVVSEWNKRDDSELADLHARMEKAEKDAERYRLIRQRHEGAEAYSITVFAPETQYEVDKEPWKSLEPVGSMPGELDSYIDAAIAKERT